MCLFFCANFYAFSQKKTAANRLLDQAKEQLELGNVKNAITLYQRAAQYDSKSLEVKYLTAVAHYRDQNYRKTLSIVEPLLSHPNPDINWFRLAGNCYDIQGNYNKATNFFLEATRKFPYDGELFLDLGIIEMIRGNMKAAVEYWETGVDTEPIAANNYYWATKIYSQSDDPIWALYYGELFMNLERGGTDRFEEVAKILYDIYVQIIKDEFYKKNHKYTIRLPYENGVKESSLQIYDLLRKNGLMKLDRGATITDGVSYMQIASLIREDFLKLWNQVYKEKYPLTLYKRHQELKDLGYLECYNFWLLNAAQSEEYTYWNADVSNKAKYQKFITWFISNPMKIDLTDFFSRKKYDFIGGVIDEPLKINKASELLGTPSSKPKYSPNNSIRNSSSNSSTYTPNKSSTTNSSPIQKSSTTSTPISSTPTKTQPQGGNNTYNPAIKIPGVYQIHEVDQVPKFKSGNKSVIKYIRDNLDMTSNCVSRIQQDINVHLSITILANGNVADVQALNQVNCDLQDDIVTILFNMPKWKPAVLKQKAVNSTYNFPVRIKL